MTPRQGSGLVTARNKTPESGARHGTNLPDRTRPALSRFTRELALSGICQFSDTKTYPSTITKVLAINPSVILLPETLESASSCVITFTSESDVVEYFKGREGLLLEQFNLSTPTGAQEVMVAVCV